MSDIVTPEAAEFLTLMLKEIRPPEDWETSEFWLTLAQQLAQFLADQRGNIPLQDAAMLVGLGGILVEMAKREREAALQVKRFLRGNGGGV